MERYIAQSLGLAQQAVANTLKLLAEGATIPFISRYRKEATGGLDEVQIAAIDTACKKLQELDKRKETVLATIEEQGKLTDELRSRIAKCMDATELEDIYLPYKPKRRTRAEVARTKGLEPLEGQSFRRPRSVRDSDLQSSSYTPSARGWRHRNTTPARSAEREDYSSKYRAG